MWLFAFFLLLIAGLAVWFEFPKRVRSYRRLCKALEKLPGEKPHWLLGNLAQAAATEEAFFRYHHTWIENGWKLNRVWFGPFFATVPIHHPDLLRHLLKLPKSDHVYSLLEPWLGKGLLIANGERWFRNRRLITPAFHFDLLKPYIYVYNQCTEILLSNWERAAVRKDFVLAYKDISKLSLDIILHCAFSYKSHCQEEGEASPYIRAVDQLCQLTAKRFLSPLLAASDFLFLYCTSRGWQYRRCLDTVHKQAEKVIKERKKALGREGKESRKPEELKTTKAAHRNLDFLDVLITAEDEDGCGLSDLEIQNEVDTFLFEGHDTAANGLCWTLYLLAKHPQHQEKCREEIRSVLRGRKHLEYEDLPSLQYTLWCIKEALRLYPPVPKIFRGLVEDIEVDGYVIPKEAWITIDIFGIHRHPDIWESLEEFNPLRFQSDEVSKRHPYAYIPFSAGIRNCIGQVFAQNEMRIVISSILNKFSLSLVKEHPVRMLPLVLTKVENDVKLQLNLIQDTN